MRRLTAPAQTFLEALRTVGVEETPDAIRERLHRWGAERLGICDLCGGEDHLRCGICAECFQQIVKGKP